MHSLMGNSHKLITRPPERMLTIRDTTAPGEILASIGSHVLIVVGDDVDRMALVLVGIIHVWPIEARIVFAKRVREE